MNRGTAVAHQLARLREELTMHRDVPCTAVADRTVDADLETRIRAEFAEMPGLKLTLPQASRLFNVERVRHAVDVPQRGQSRPLQRRANAFG
jgi:hypothetical protein